ncbi:MAG: alpha/beta fold hydrolase [Gammaproteobacteria bacterium]
MNDLALSPSDQIAALDAAARRHHTPCGEGSVVWRQWGSGPPLVLLHGGSGSWKHWIRNIPVFARRYTVWAPDLPGFGDSDVPPRPYTIPGLGDYVADGLDRLVDPAVAVDIAAFSFGAIMCSYVAAQRPERVRRLAMLGTRFGTSLVKRELPMRDWRQARDEAEWNAILRHNLRTMMLAHDATIDALTLKMYGDDLRRSRVYSRPLYDHATHMQALARIRRPVLGIMGALDALAHPDVHSQVGAARAMNPMFSMELVEDAGHWVQYEAPERCNELLLRFFNPESETSP